MIQPIDKPSPLRAILIVVGVGLAVLVVVWFGQQAVHQHAKPQAGATASKVTGGGLTLTSVSIKLPNDDPLFPAGPGADLMNANCTACHSASMALTQPAFSKAQWTATVEKMRETYKAQIAEQDVPAIVDYLASVSAKLAPPAVGR